MKHAFVNFSKQTGIIKPMHAVNQGPFGNCRGLGNRAAYMEAGFPYARNHDSAFFSVYGGEHAHDVLNIFPNFDADETDPANYDFTMTDHSCLDTESSGTKIFFRLGSKIEHEFKKYQTKPPRDYGKWARICEHIIAHLCYGWAEGQHLDISYWEIWNEADGLEPDGSKACWQGTMEEFINFYEVVSKHLKHCYPELKIGGPSYTGEPYSWKHIETFLAEAEKRSIPLDFFSWHGYTTDPHHYEKSTARVKTLLDIHGYGQAELILNEWNYVRGWVHQDMLESYKTIANEKGAAFTAASMLTAQKSPMNMFMYYDAGPNGAFNGLFAPFTYQPQLPYYAFWQFNKLYKLQNEVDSGTDCEDLYIGAATNGNAQAIQFVYYSDTPKTEVLVELSLRGMQENTEFLCLLVDKTHANEPIRSDRFTVSEGKLYLKLKPNSVLLITGSPLS